MRRTFTAFAVVILFSVLASTARAQTSYPMLTSTYPPGGQRGKAVEVTVSGTGNFYGAQEVLFAGAGVAATVLPQPAPPADKNNPNAKPTVNTVTMRVTVAPDAPLGVREFRVMTPRGVSSVGLFIVGDEPEVTETEPNNEPAKAQPVTLPATINGKLQAAEDLDFFKFHAEAGEEVSFSVLSARLQDKIHDLQTHVDPLLALFDPSGRRLATSKDYFRADDFLVYKFAKAGDYVLQIRDVRYQGNPHWVYRLTVTNRPFVTAALPLGIKRGASAEVELVGVNVGATNKVKVDMPPDAPMGERDIRLKTENGETNPVAVVVSDVEEMMEAEDNDAPAQANRLPPLFPLPSQGGTGGVAVNGRIGKENDVDKFAFHAEKGQAVVFEVEARRYGSRLDAYLSVLDANGKEIAANDDAGSLDARLEFTAPNAGDYIVQVRDLNNRGGADFVYRLTAQPSRPDFTLRVDPDKNSIGPGVSAPFFVRVDRAGGFAGAVTVQVSGLPKGVTATPLTIPPSMTQGCIVITAAPDAPIAASNVQIVGKATLPPLSSPLSKGEGQGEVETITRNATPMQEIYIPGGGRGLYAVNLLTVAVTEPSDLSVEVNTQQVTLQPGGAAKIEVTVQRRADYTKGVVLDVLLRHLGSVYANPLPPGVTIDEGASKTLLGANENKGHIVLKAAPDAPPIENVPICVMGQVSINFVVKVSYGSPAILLSVKK